MKKPVFLALLLIIILCATEVLGNSIPSNLRKELKPKELKYFHIVKAAAEKYDIDASWLMAIIKVESNFNHKAASSKGAIGLMQLMPKTAKSLGINDPFEPRKNVEAGAKYFSRLVQSFGRMELALAAYNAGPTRVRKLRRVPLFRQTINYVAKVLKHQKRYSVIISPLISSNLFDRWSKMAYLFILA